MDSHLLPTILIYHSGIDINAGLIARDRVRIAADLRWVPLERGVPTGQDLFSGEWAFWSVVDEPVDELRRRYRIPPPVLAEAAVRDDGGRRQDFVRAGMPPPPRVSLPGVGDGPPAAQ
ncbi:MAG: hypothetical protein ACRDTD_23645 [Pseudonocardiaceae bacterium]